MLIVKEPPNTSTFFFSTTHPFFHEGYLVGRRGEKLHTTQCNVLNERNGSIKIQQAEKNVLVKASRLQLLYYLR